MDNTNKAEAPKVKYVVINRPLDIFGCEKGKKKVTKKSVKVGDTYEPANEQVAAHLVSLNKIKKA